MREYSLIDRFLIGMDQALQTVHAPPRTTERENPADDIPEAEDLPANERDLTGRLMRINHAGEIAAQGLYQGQALTARDPQVKQQMQRSSEEENDHLAWCEQRIEELGGHKSYLGPFWYLGSYGIGAAAGLLGDKWSLGFVRETENQVVEHIDGHMNRVSEHDLRTRAILDQMRVDEARHAYKASVAGAAHLPSPVRRLMRLASRVMTGTAYWV
ncbi:MAG: 2-polyprenyl-3-methyl-6-methoxy-1,4-benzoquinone monooxygenase [Pseudomonadota bacterium]|nr:2-polyprenyl-3-methyl-6-methoxy-1,4-benzoquinone monooxygenase [Pseudomonadota bacterium]